MEYTVSNLPLREPELKGDKCIKVCTPIIGKREKDYVKDCLESGWISSLGNYVTKFQDIFSAKMGCQFGVAVSSGTAALHLCLEAIGIKPGDEVVVPSFTMIATANAVSYCGAKPIFVDCEPETLCIDPLKIVEKITEKTKAIIAVHIYGHPCDMDAINSIARQYDLWVVEDSAEAHGARYHGRPCGSLGDISAFSTYANKIITTGEGGVITTNNKNLADICAYLKDFCFSPERHFWHKRLGYNYRMTNLQAAIGLGQTERLEEIVQKKLEIAYHYNKRLQPTRVRIPETKEGCFNVHWMYGIRVNANKDKLRIYLADHGVETRNFFIPMHLQPIYKTRGKFPISEYAMEHGIYLPSGLGLTEEKIDKICKLIKRSG
jgi:perosamine synthetase